MKKSLIKTIIVGVILVTNVATVSAANIQERVRLGGRDRVETAIEVSKEFEKDNKVETVLLCSNRAWADAMAAAPLAAYKNAPILLLDAMKFDWRTKARLKEMKDLKHIIIVGGGGIISPSLEYKIQDLRYKVTRIGGKDRYETNRKIMEYIPKEKYGYRPKIVNGNDYNQALACAVDTIVYDSTGKNPLGDNEYVNPMFLVDSDYATNSTFEDISDKLSESRKFWESKGQDSYSVYLDKFFINRVKNNRGIEGINLLEKTLNGKVKPLSNGYGEKDPYKVNGIVNREIKDIIVGSNKNEVYNKEKSCVIVNGDTFADSLSVSALAAKKSIPIVFVNRDMRKAGYEDASEIEKVYKDTYKDVLKVYYVGGKEVCPDGRENILNGIDK
ncbi:cell wall-binding repeat-containing protein [Clostridium rectalis]|uniref:cell wall-binding repeat-containing protein n=1 Tax=Clostridium rectalis TaxID=2040295 RepID=UPI000F63E98F|nr:cell wall-binding repeat-containing protein [Clostridium rectalis]